MDPPAAVALFLLTGGWACRWSALHPNAAGRVGGAGGAAPDNDGRSDDDDAVERLLDRALARRGHAVAERRRERQKLRAAAEAVLERAARLGLTPIAWGDRRYPAALVPMPDPPILLWLRGDEAALQGRAVAIVGSRAASRYALEVAEKLAADLAEKGIIIVSGLARGADAAAHRGALSRGARTVAVLGCGVDRLYPSEHGLLARALLDGSGALVSEFLPGTPPRRAHFPLRNRIISGLSLAVVVVEASNRSGSLITARWALDQGREVLAVPGNVLTGRNSGAHGLLKDGARLVEDVQDVLEALPGWERLPGGRVEPAPPEDRLLALMTPGEPQDFDELMECSGLDGPRLLPRLLELELSGRVARVGGGRFVRLRNG
jgi:DNA processing protein